MMWLRRICLLITVSIAVWLFGSSYSVNDFAKKHFYPEPSSHKTPGGSSWSGKVPSFAGATTARQCSVPLMGVHVTSTRPTLTVLSLCGRDGKARFPVLIIAADDTAPSVWPSVCEGLTYVTMQEQRTLAAAPSALGRFVAAMSFTPAARKNVGYALALQRGACRVWDFGASIALHPDEPLNVSMAEATLKPHHGQLIGMRPRLASDLFVNPYPALSPSSAFWPRGLPLQESTEPAALCGELIRLDASVAGRVAVMQPAAEGQPDASTHVLAPAAAEATLSYVSTLKHIIVHGAFAPYTSVASLHLAPGLWALYQPPSVPERTADIWRAYASQAVFRAFGLSVAFVPAWIRRGRSRADLAADAEGERGLLTHTRAVGSALANLSVALAAPQADPLSALNALVRTYIVLNQIGAIGSDDVKGAIAWAQVIQELGVEYPVEPLRPIAPRSPQRPACAEFPDVHTAIQINHGHWRAIAVWHAVFASFYGSVSYHVQLNMESDTKRSPFPVLTTFRADTRLGESGDDSYVSLLEALQHTPDVRRREVLLWQHDDSFIHPAGLRRWMAHGVSAVGIDESRALPTPDKWATSDWVWARKPQNQLSAKMFTQRAPPGMCDEYARPRNLTTGRVHWQRGQADVLVLRLNATRLWEFVTLLHLMNYAGMFLEIAVPTAVVCTFPPEEVDPFNLYSDWHYWTTRNDPRHYAAVLKANGDKFAQYHPVKLKSMGSVITVMEMRDAVMTACTT